MFLNDPEQIYSELKPAWIDFRERVNELAAKTYDQVVLWREADNQAILPTHPMSATIDTTGSDGLWRDRTNLFVPEVKNANRRVRHGFDAAGQVVVAERELYSKLLMRGDHYLDVAAAFRSRDGHWETNPTRPKFSRYYLGDGSRILQVAKYSPTEEDSLDLETFCWQSGRPVETFLQSFNSGTEIPGWAKDRSAAEIAALYRNGPKYREYMPRRSIRRYCYDADEQLIEVEEERLRRNIKNTIYTRNTEDTIESVFDELLPMLTQRIVAVLKKVKQQRPLQTVVLLYSAEHIHTGLPWGIACQLDGLPSEPLLEPDSYKIHVPWPPEKRAGQLLQNCINRFRIAVESSPMFREDISPKPFRELLWQVSTLVAGELRSSRVTADGFTVFPLDDHGDVDPIKDLQECLPDAGPDSFPALTGRSI